MLPLVLALLSGLNAANTLEVVAHGTHFSFSINGVPVGQAEDATYATGRFGLAGIADTDVVFTNLTLALPR